VAVVPSDEGNIGVVRQNDLADWLRRVIRRHCCSHHREQPRSGSCTKKRYSFADRVSPSSWHSTLPLLYTLVSKIAEEGAAQKHGLLARDPAGHRRDAIV
jgi:hypothetical protein